MIRPTETPDSAPGRVSALPGYVGKAGRFDECLAPDGSIRSAWSLFLGQLGVDPAQALRDASEASRRTILEQDVSMNVYSGDQAGARPWPLDVVPLIIDAADWEHLGRGLRQRAHLFNALLSDLYGPQTLLKEGRLPAVLAMANPHFLRPCVRPGTVAAGGVSAREPFLHFYAADVARSPDGRWWVIEDRLDAPSGLGYSLQNRILVRQALPEIFNATPVRRLQRFFRGLRQSLATGTDGSERSRVVFLTPGPANETYFEHAYLARYLGYPLVEGADLTTRDHRVFLRTVGGLQPVDTILRRVDSDFCDPLELNERSLLGIPGLVDAMQTRRVTIANRLGARALETTALLAFLGPLCRELRDEELEIPSVATWWCGQAEALAYVLANLHGLIIKPTFPSPDGPPLRYGAMLTVLERDALADEIRARPWAYCGQERVYLGTTPGWHAESASLHAMPFTARIYLAWENGDYHAMPGGLTRCNVDGEDSLLEPSRVSLQTGSISKDTWIIDPARTSPARLEPPVVVRRLARHAHATPSRLADNLFWLGRYVERLGQLARQLGRVDVLLRDELAAYEPEVAWAAVTLVRERLEAGLSTLTDIEALADEVRRLAFDANVQGSAASLAHRLAIVLEAVKSRLPPEAGPIARRLRTLSSHDGQRSVAMLRADLTALDGALAETLPRDTAWRFLDLGRRIERGCQVLYVLRRMFMAVTPGTALSEFRLQTALRLADSHFAYRAIFPGSFESAAVLAWLVSDPENARSLRFQAELIGQHLEALPDILSPAAVVDMRERAFRLLSRVRLFNAESVTDDLGASQTLWTELLVLHAELSNRVTDIYFAHAGSAAPEGLF